MNEDQIKKIVDDSYDTAREDTLLSMASDFYSRKMMSTAILVWAWAILFLALAVYSAIQFFGTDDTKAQILYAVLFISGAHGIGLMKIFAWEMVHRHSIKREIKRLELRMAEFSEKILSAKA